MTQTKVLVVDDSALVRKMLTGMLESDPGIEVVGSAPDPYIARDKIKRLRPDVLTLDVEMPRMDGVTFLRNLMRLRPMPVVMVSSVTQSGAEQTLEALEIGAVDFVAKPNIDGGHTLSDYQREIIEKVKSAATAKVKPYFPGRATAPDPVKVVPERYSADAILRPISANARFRTTVRIVAIGASTGGTEAIREVLSRLPADTPGTVITQHIPAPFSASFAKRMDHASAMCVVEASNGDQIVNGHVYIAPGDKHLLVRWDGARYVCELNDGRPVNRHKPSVDVLFRSLARDAGPNAIGVILTGMGDDGARGLKEMHELGAPTFAQDERTSVVWGMPGESVRQGGVDEILPLDKIADAISRSARRPCSPSRTHS